MHRQYSLTKPSRLAIVFSILYIIAIVLLFFYSFTQIDLNLTLSRWSLAQMGEKFFQHIGYFNRPLSTLLYCAILFLLFGCYIGFLFLAQKNELTRKRMWILIIFTAVLLMFSYNAFSYDIFNYIFDARIFTYYHQNPYMHKALDFPQDHMLLFMRWVHRIYPYGPVWLAITIPLSYLGMQIFLPTFFLFKALMAASFLGTAYMIEKIANKYLKTNTLFVLIFFCLNPLVIIESLVSGHIDVVMMFMSLVSTYVLLNKKYLQALILLTLSIGIKFATIVLLPVYLFVFYQNRKKKDFDLDTFFLIYSLMLIAAVIAESIRTQFQPWYLLAILPYAAFISKKMFVLLPGIIIPLFALCEYIPYLYTGNWNPPIPTILNILTASGIVLSLGIVGIMRLGLFKKVYK